MMFIFGEKNKYDQNFGMTERFSQEQSHGFIHTKDRKKHKFLKFDSL